MKTCMGLIGVLTMLLASVAGQAQLYRIAPDAIFIGFNNVRTNVPDSASGMDVNAFLGADTFYNLGYTGTNATVANIEAGHVWDGHQTLTHVSVKFTGTGALGSNESHATSVGMMIGGRGTGGGSLQTGLGMGANLKSGAIATAFGGGGSFSITGESLGSVYDHYFGAVDVINSSWGGTDTTGSGGLTIALDGFCNLNPTTTFVVAAGNTGPGTNTVNGAGSGFNAITVGALGGANSYSTIASFSSRGPMDYQDPVNGTVNGVHAAVDIVAPGTELWAATTGTPSSYTIVQGTSFSAPIVAGGVALLHDLSIGQSLAGSAREARVLKSVLLNAADKVSGWTNNQAVDGGGVIRTAQALDWTYGAGVMNLDQAYAQMLGDTRDVAGLGGGTVGVTGWDSGAVSLNGSTDYLLGAPLLGGSTFTSTLNWFRDRSAVYVEGQGEPLDGLWIDDLSFADLNLYLYDGTFTNLLAVSESQYNSVEHLSVVIPATGIYGIRVGYDGNMFGNAISEEYGLAWWGVEGFLVVPEPASAGLLLVAGLLLMRRRRR